MDCKQIQGILMSQLYASHPIMCPNFAGGGYDESDVLAISSSNVVKEYEIKISRADFKADFKKVRKHARFQNPKDGWAVPNKFYYVCPEGLIAPEEVPAYAGLIHITEITYLGRPDFIAKTIKEAPYLHKDKPTPKAIIAVTKAAVAKMIFGKAYMTWQNEQFRLLSTKEYDEFKRIRQNTRILTHDEWDLVMEYQSSKLMERLEKK